MRESRLLFLVFPLFYTKLFLRKVKFYLRNVNMAEHSHPVFAELSRSKRNQNGVKRGWHGLVHGRLRRPSWASAHWCRDAGTLRRPTVYRRREHPRYGLCLRVARQGARSFLLSQYSFGHGSLEASLLNMRLSDPSQTKRGSHI